MNSYNDISKEQIAIRAYYIHQKYGGDPLDNWLQAEREILLESGMLGKLSVQESTVLTLPMKASSVRRRKWWNWFAKD